MYWKDNTTTYNGHNLHYTELIIVDNSLQLPILGKPSIDSSLENWKGKRFTNRWQNQYNSMGTKILFSLQKRIINYIQKYGGIVTEVLGIRMILKI